MSGGILPILTNVNPTPLWVTSGGGSNAPSGNISSLYGYDQYTIYSSTFKDDSVTFTLANNYVEQQFLSDGSNYSRITNGPDGLLLEAFYVSTISPPVGGTRDITLFTFNNFTGQQLQAGLDAATSSFFVSCVNGIVSETATMSNLNLSVLDLDGQILTATPTDLLLNGSTIAVAQNISSLSEWAYDPAISTIQGNGQDLTGIRAGFFSSITANGIVAENLTVISTIQNFNYISTQQVNTEILSAQSLEVSSINGYSWQDQVVSSLTATNFVSTAAIIASTFNGYTVSDFLSTSASQYDPNPLFSTVVININGFISTPDLEVSSINGHEFNQNTVIISTVNTDQLNAIQISSLVGDVSLQLVSTLSFSASLGSNSFSLGGIDLGLGNIFGQITGGALGIMSLVTSGVALGTGVAALHQTRATNNINTANYELVNGTTQLQVSTIGEFVSSVYRFSSGNPADQVVGSEFFTSTIYAPGTTLLRSMGDPLNTVSTPLSTLQAFGQWVALPEAPAVSTVSTFVDLVVLSNTSTQTLNVDYINGFTGNTVAFGDPANGNNVFFDTLVTAPGLQIDSFPQGNGFLNVDKLAVDFIEAKAASDITVNANVQRLVASNTNFLTSTVQIGPSTILTAENDFPGLAVRQADDSSIAQVNASAFVVGDPDDIFQGAYTYSAVTDRATVLNSSLQTKFVAYLDDLQDIQNNSISTNTLEAGVARINALSTNRISTASISSQSIACFSITAGNTNFNNASVSTQLTFAGPSSINFSTVTTAGTQGQPSGRLCMSGQDLDVGQNDIWAQQVRIGAANSAAAAELVLYQPDNATKAFNVQSGDRTIRVGSSQIGGGILVNSGYVLDTLANPPFFSTIGPNLALMSYFPSTSASTIGISTLSLSPVATSAFDATLLASALTTAPQVFVSTTITTSLVSSYVLCQANTSGSNSTNQYHSVYLNVQIDNVMSPSTFTSLPAGIDHYANANISFRSYVGPGVHTLRTWMSCDANGVGTITQCDMWATGNLQ